MPDKTITIPKRLTRAATFVQSEGKPTMISVSSDTPYLRSQYVGNGEWEDYLEVLDHSPQGLDSERLEEGLPILFNHDRDANLANARKYENDGHRLSLPMEGLIWASGEFAENKKNDIESGALPHTSVGYEITGDGICIGAKDGIAVYKFPWKIYEASVVTVPADATVGVGREKRHAGESEDTIKINIKSLDEPNNLPHKENTDMKLSSRARLHFEADKDKGGSDAPQIDAAKERAEALKEFKARCKTIDEFVKGLDKHPAWQKAAAAIAEKHKDGEADFEAFRSEANKAFVTPGHIDTPENPDGKRAIDGQFQIVRKSAGERFVESKSFKSALERPRDQGSRNAAVVCEGQSFLGVRARSQNMQARAGWDSANLAAINIAPQTTLIQLGQERLTIMDLISPGTTSAAAIPYPRENSFGTVNGVAVPANQMPRAINIGETELKPLWEPDLTTETANVRKIAVITKVPDEFMSDFPGMQSYIDQRLPFMVDNQAEYQILYGDGLGNNLKGITVVGGILTRAYATSIHETVRKAITDIEATSFFTVDGIVMHPYDFEIASLEKDLNGQYLMGGPYFLPYGNGTYISVRTMWGKPVIATTACAVGKPIVGCWKLGAQYFMREGMQLATTNSNEDDFRRNLVAIRAEERLALAVYRPACFLEITGVPART